MSQAITNNAIIAIANHPLSPLWRGRRNLVQKTWDKILTSFEEEEEEPGKYNLSKEWDEYEIGQNITSMKIINKKVK